MDSKFGILALLAFGSLLNFAETSVVFTKCKTSSIGEVINVDISGCDTASTCKLIRGKNATITISFHTPKQVEQLETVVHGIVHGLPVPFSFPYPDACAVGGLVCPLKPNTPQIYTATLPILSIYPRLSVKIQWQLQDEDQNDVICIQIPTVLH